MSTALGHQSDPPQVPDPASLPELASEHPVCDELVAEFRATGHVVVRALASAAEIAAYRPVIEDAVRRLSAGTRPLAERDTYGKAFLQVTNIWRRDEAVARFVLARRFAQVAARLMGVDGVRLYHDQALFKEAGGGLTPFHQDQYYWPFDGDATITMWMPLVPVTEEIGSMYFADGSHRLGYLGSFQISDSSEAVFRKVIVDRALPVSTHGALAPGDATFHSGWTLHGAPANPTGNLRSVMTVIYFADGMRVADDVREAGHDLATWLPGCKPGDLALSELNPLVWSANDDVGS